MYDIYHVANYIISQCNKMELKITHDILQNLLFLVQKEFVAVFKHRCFEDNFYALETGPLNLEINRKYFSYHNRNLHTECSGFNECSCFSFSKSDKYVVDSIICEYAEDGEEKIVQEISSDKSYLEARIKSDWYHKEKIVFLFE